MKETKTKTDAQFIGFQDSIEHLSRKLSNRSVIYIIFFYIMVLNNIYVIDDTISIMEYSNNLSLAHLKIPSFSHTWQIPKNSLNIQSTGEFFFFRSLYLTGIRYNYVTF